MIKIIETAKMDIEVGEGRQNRIETKKDKEISDMLIWTHKHTIKHVQSQIDSQTHRNKMTINGR